MGTRIKCFFIQPTELVERSLRRYGKIHYLQNSDGSYILDDNGRAVRDPAYEEDERCAGPMGYHDAHFIIDPQALSSSVLDGITKEALLEDRTDTRWPKMCLCGYAFKDDDHWQHSSDRIFLRHDEMQLATLREIPAGAMWNASWLGESFRGADGRCLVLKTPGGDWTIDGPSSGGGKWDRTGHPPDITVTPSILFPPIKNPAGVVVSPGYHGWLRNGWLEEC